MTTFFSGLAFNFRIVPVPIFELNYFDLFIFTSLENYTIIGYGNINYKRIRKKHVKSVHEIINHE